MRNETTYGLFSREKKFKNVRLLRVSMSKTELEALKRTLEHRRQFGVLTIETVITQGERK
jgi:hypothetical protein